MGTEQSEARSVSYAVIASVEPNAICNIGLRFKKVDLPGQKQTY